MGVHHHFTDGHSDGTDSSVVRPSDWNRDHDGNATPGFLVASAGATSKEIAAADYVCTGTADQVGINAAITALPSGGGTVWLSSGTFNIAASVTWALAKGFALRGTGWGTILHAVNGLNDDVIKFAPPSSGIWCEVTHLKIEGNAANQTTAGNGIYAFGAIQCVFDYLWINAPYMNGLYLYQDGAGGTGHHNRVTRCLFDQGNTSPSGDGRGLLLQASDENYVAFNDFESNGRAAAAEPNHLFDRSGLQTILGNVFVGGQTGVKCEGSRSRVVSNMFDGTGNHSIRLNGNQTVVIDNTIMSPGSGSGSPIYDGVFVDNVSGCVVNENNILSDNTGTRSGINFANGATANMALSNNFSAQGSGYGTAPIIPGLGNTVRNNLGNPDVGTGNALYLYSNFR